MWNKNKNKRLMNKISEKVRLIRTTIRNNVIKIMQNTASYIDRVSFRSWRSSFPSISLALARFLEYALK
jgi:hypothetical protein